MIKLRKIEPNDLPFLYQWENDAASWADGANHNPLSQQDLRDYIASTTGDIYRDGQLRLIIEQITNDQSPGASSRLTEEVRDRSAEEGFPLITNHQLPITNYQSPMIIACDFDGTIVTHEYPRIGKPIPFAIQTLKKLQEEDHHQIILWTVREGALLQEALDYCKSKGLEFYAVNSNYPEEEPAHGTARKLVADLWIDDRNLGGLPDWGVIYNMIHTGHPYEPAPQGNMEDLSLKKKKGFFAKLFD